MKLKTSKKYFSRVRNKDLPAVYFDQHIKPGIVEAFKEQKFTCLLISKTKKYSGDEKDYINKIASEEKLFATSDREFVDYVFNKNVQHAGILLIPNKWDNDVTSFATAGLVGLIKGYLDKNGKRALRNKIFYLKDDGYHIIEKGKDELIYSIDAMEIDLNI